MSTQHLVNPDAMATAIMAVAAMEKAAALAKQAFVPAGDPVMDPSGQQAGGAPPPGAGGGGGAGGDPSGGAGAGGGAPPAAPPPADPNAIAQQVIQMLQAQGMGGGGQGGMEPIKPKIDVNVTLLQILKILAKIADALKIPIPASEMVATQNDLTQFGMQQATGVSGGGGAGAGAGAGGAGAIPPIQPIQGATMGGGMGAGKTAGYVANGESYDTGGLENLGNRVATIIGIRAASAARTRPAA